MKTIKKVSVIVLVVLIGLMMFACKEKVQDAPLNILISGDIENFRKEIDIKEFDKQDFTNGEETLSGYKLDNVIDRANVLVGDNWLLLTANDKVSARIEMSSSNLVYIVEEGDKLNIKAPNHPRLVGIKDLIEITVIEKESSSIGLTLISEEREEAELISYGNLKLNLFEESAENVLTGIVAYKHLPKKDYKLNMLTSSEKNLIFLYNQDIIKAGNADVLWTDGCFSCKVGETIYKDIKGFVSGTETVVMDGYGHMKEALDNNKKVMFILPDGLSLQQVKHYENDLSFFNNNYTVASSVHPAISNVSLASMVTGKSPFEHGLLARGVKKPLFPDIFEYATNLGKKTSYIEGSGNLIVTSLFPKLNIPDVNGYTDVPVFNSAMAALNDDDPDLLFVHFHGIDDVNHLYSPISFEAKAKIIETEGYIQQLIEKFDGTVIIVPDHGAITYYDGTIPKGKHGLFEKNDMLIPYYLLKED